MRNRIILASLSLALSPLAIGQMMPELDFASVGRGAPIADAQDYEIVGAMNFFGFEGVAAQNGDVPEGVEPIAVDIFTTNDFYEDKDLWMDPLYCR